MSLPLQDVLEGKYEILEKIGEGGIGSVYRVRHRLLEEVRVIKVLRPEAAAKEELRERFLHEARMAIRLKHPNIAQLHDFSIAEDDRAYIVMEFIDGVSLDALLETAGPPSVDLTLEISRQALAALEYLHDNDYVHRDVSPDNVMLTTSFDGGPLVKLIDLGIARHLGAEIRLTATGVFLGKARYCSPEQFSAGGESAAELDRRADIYSFGVMLYELLTGIYPFAGDTFAALAGGHLFQPPKDLAETDPEGRLPDGLRAAVLKALEKSPDDRFATAADFAAALEPFRDPQATLKEEFDRTVEIATTAMPRIPGRAKPGSTQERLDRQFGARETSAVDTAPAATAKGETVIAKPRRTLEESVALVAGLVSRGRGRRAARALGRALTAHGEAAELIALRPQVEGLLAAGGRGRRPVILALAAAGLAIAGGLALWWWLGRPPTGEPPASGPATVLWTMTRTPSWDAATVAGSATLPAAAELAPPPDGESAAAPEPTQPAAPEVASEPPPQPAAGSGEPPPPPSPPSTAEPQPRVSQQIFEPGIGVVPPVLVSLPEPELPAGARKLKDEITVVVRVLVNETGGVSTALIASGPSFRRHYRDAAVEAAGGATFRPARSGDTLGRMWTEVHVTFRPQ